MKSGMRISIARCCNGDGSCVEERHVARDVAVGIGCDPDEVALTSFDPFGRETVSGRGIAAGDAWLGIRAEHQVDVAASQERPIPAHPAFIVGRQPRLTLRGNLAGGGLDQCTGGFAIAAGPVRAALAIRHIHGDRRPPFGRSGCGVMVGEKGNADPRELAEMDRLVDDVVGREPDGHGRHMERDIQLPVRIARCADLAQTIRIRRATGEEVDVEIGNGHRNAFDRGAVILGHDFFRRESSPARLDLVTGIVVTGRHDDRQIQHVNVIARLCGGRSRKAEQEHEYSGHDGDDA